MAKVVRTKLLVEFRLSDDFNTEGNEDLRILLGLMFNREHLGGDSFVDFLGKPKIRVVKEITYEKVEDVEVEGG